MALVEALEVVLPVVVAGRLAALVDEEGLEAEAQVAVDAADDK